MTSNDCGCGPGVVSVPTASVNSSVQTVSSHCLSSEYRIDFRGQATGDPDPVIVTTPDKVLWSPLPDNSIYNGAPCLTDKSDDTYREIDSLSDWMQWFEKYVSAAYCLQTAKSCQWSHATNGSETIAAGLVSCLGLSEDSYMLGLNLAETEAEATKLGFDSIPCETILELLQVCVPDAPANEVPDTVLGLSYATGYDAVNDDGTVNGAYRYGFSNVPQYSLEAKISAVATQSNNTHAPAIPGTRYQLRNVEFINLQASPTLISQFNTANGRLVCATDDTVWVSFDMTIFCRVEYTATGTESNSINVNLGIATYDAAGNAEAEFRLDSDRLFLIAGTQQTIGLHGVFTYPLSGVGKQLEPRIWIGGSFAGNVDLQIASAESRISIRTEEELSYLSAIAA